MSMSLSEQRMAENEVVFRQNNEKIQRGFESIKTVAIEEKEAASYERYDNPVPFYCECSDENCHKRVQLSPSRYREIHIKRNRFVIVPGHQVVSIEKVITEEKEYSIVEKLIPPPVSAEKLQKTEVDNS